MNAHVAKDEIFFSSVAGEKLSRPVAGPRHSGGVAGLLRRLAAAVPAAIHRHAVIAELNMLSDRELSDIGLTRPEVGRVFDAGFLASRRGA